MWRKMSGEQAVILGGKRFFFYSVDKEDELFPMNLDGIDRFFRSLDTQGKKAIAHAVVLFDGYNDVTTELYEVPEVRKFVSEMFNRYPYLLNYVNFDLEGHQWLLSCWLDVRVMYTGEKLTFDEHIRKYGPSIPMPRYNVHMTLPNWLLDKTVDAMREHGRKLKAEKNVESQIRRLKTIFGRM